MSGRLTPLAMVVLVGLAGGVLTSFGQTYLPDAVRSLANSAGPWCLVAWAVARRRSTRPGQMVAGVLVLVAMVVGYYATADLRGYAAATDSVLRWALAAVLIGPWLGLRRWGTLILGVVLVAESAYGLTVVASSTSPVGWGIELAAGLLVLGALGQAVLRGARGQGGGRSLGDRWAGPVRDH